MALFFVAKVNQLKNIQNKSIIRKAAVPPFVNVCEAKWYPINTMEVLGL